MCVGKSSPPARDLFHTYALSRDTHVSTRIDLDFREWPHPDITPHGIMARVIRIATDVLLWDGTSWRAPREGWIDTGAPLTILPENAWQGLQVRILATGLPLSVAGANVVADLAEVILAVKDGGQHASPILTVRAYLSPQDDLPIILGMEDFLTRCTLHCDHAPKTAYLEFP